MTKIVYNGDISPCRIRLNGITFGDWKTGEVRDIPENLVNRILENENFKKVSEKKQTKSLPKEEPEEVLEEPEDESFESDD